MTPTPVDDLVAEVTGICNCHESYTSRDKIDPQCCPCNCGAAIKDAIERAVRERTQPEAAPAAPPAGMTLVNTQLFDSIVRALTPEQMQSICWAEGERLKPPEAAPITLTYEEREEVIRDMRGVRLTDWSTDGANNPTRIAECSASDLLDAVLAYLNERRRPQMDQP